MSGDRPHLLDLIRNNTLDVQLASMLWLLVESKSSLISYRFRKIFNLFKFAFCYRA